MSSPVSPTNFRRVDASPLVRVTARILTAPPTTGFAELGDAAPLPTVSPWMRVSQPPEWFLITSRRMRFASLVSAADSSCTHPSLLPSVIFAFAVVHEPESAPDILMRTCSGLYDDSSLHKMRSPDSRCGGGATSSIQ